MRAGAAEARRLDASVPPVLEAVALRKCYGGEPALAGLSFAVRAGEAVGLLGPNGAGKTTTLSILSSVFRPDGGRVTLGGHDLRSDRRLRRRIGLVPQALAIYPALSPWSNAIHFGRMLGLSHAEARASAESALASVGLTERAHLPTKLLSGGMQRRVNLACGIVHRPDVLLLDEPTVGVDIESREQILALVRQLRAAGTAIVYSTHYMEEVERLCDRVVLIDRGRLIADDTVEALIARAGSRPLMQLTTRDRRARSVVASLEGVRDLSDPHAEGPLVVELAQLAQVAVVLEALRASGVPVLDFTLHSPNLADAFLALTGRRLREDVEA